ASGHQRGARVGERLLCLVGAADIDDGLVADVFEIDRPIEPFRVGVQSKMKVEQRTRLLDCTIALFNNRAIPRSCPSDRAPVIVLPAAPPSPSGGWDRTAFRSESLLLAILVSNFAVSAASTKRGMLPDDPLCAARGKLVRRDSASAPKPWRGQRPPLHIPTSQ